ncbi:MAG: transglutaminase family protein [Agriterribacter sp.]
MQYKVTHTTTYEYNEPASLCHNLALLKPRSTVTQICHDAKLTIDPQPDIINEYEDFFGNKATYFAIQQEHSKLTVTVTSLVENISPKAIQFNFYESVAWEEAKKQINSPQPEYADIRQFISETPITAYSEKVEQYARQSFLPGKPLFDATNHLMQRIYNDFEYMPGFTTIATPVAEVIKKRKGVCQDFAHVAIACIRSLGLPARYVSGYIETMPADNKEKLVGADASHAWFSVFIPATGWVDFDPTNNQIPSSQHITIGWGRDFTDITPLKGVILSSGKHKLSVAVEVKRM